MNNFQKVVISGNTYGFTDLDAIHSLSGYATEQWVENYTYDKDTIDDKIASGGTFDPTLYYKKSETSGKTEIQNALDDKQDTLSAGTGINITDNVISVTGGGESSGVTSGEVQIMISEAISGLVTVEDNEVEEKYIQISGVNTSTIMMAYSIPPSDIVIGKLPSVPPSFESYCPVSFYGNLYVVDKNGTVTSGTVDVALASATADNLVPASLSGLVSASIEETSDEIVTITYTAADGYKITKPSMYTYPCQYTSEPIGGGNVSWYIKYDGGQSKNVIEDTLEPKMVDLYTAINVTKQNKLKQGAGIQLNQMTNEIRVNTSSTIQNSDWYIPTSNAVYKAISGMTGGNGIQITGPITARTISLETTPKTYSAGTGIEIGGTIDPNVDVINFAYPISVGENGGLMLGNSAVASEFGSVAEGWSSALTLSCHSEGRNTLASGYCAHAEGDTTQALGYYSHAEGRETLAKNAIEHASGRFNISHSSSPLEMDFGDSGNTLFSIGNGVPVFNGHKVEHNAIEIMQSGDIYIADTFDDETSFYFGKPMIHLQEALRNASGGGIASGDVQTMIDESISGKVDYVNCQYGKEVGETGVSGYTLYNYKNGSIDKKDLFGIGNGLKNRYHTATDYNSLEVDMDYINTNISGDVQSMINESISGKQDTLSAGDYITIDSANTISTSGLVTVESNEVDGFYEELDGCRYGACNRWSYSWCALTETYEDSADETIGGYTNFGTSPYQTTFGPLFILIDENGNTTSGESRLDINDATDETLVPDTLTDKIKAKILDKGTSVWRVKYVALNGWRILKCSYRAMEWEREYEFFPSGSVFGYQKSYQGGQSAYVIENIVYPELEKRPILKSGRAISILSDKTINFTLPIYSGEHGNIQMFTTSGMTQYETSTGTYNITMSNGIGGSGTTLFTVGNGGGINSTKHNALDIRYNGDIYIPDTNASGAYYQKPMIKLQDKLAEINNKPNAWCGTQAEYDAITEKDPNTIYLIHD